MSYITDISKDPSTTTEKIIDEIVVTAATATATKKEEETLLPENLANMVTAVSLATRISLRCSSLFFDTIFEAAKYGTSLSLGISRNALTNALSTAKNLHHDKHLLIYSSSSDKEEQLRLFNNNNLFVKVLEKYTNIGLYIVSHTFSLAELFAMSGLQFTSRTIQSSLKAAEESVRIIDGIFGCNDTSRAIASFITLVHRELVDDPEFELAKLGKVAILAGLTKALTAFAVLQNVTHKRMMKQIPMTLLWEGLVTEEIEEAEADESDKIIQFKNNSDSSKAAPDVRKKKKNKRGRKDDDIIIQELNALLKQQQQQERQAAENKQYRVTTKTTCITTKTTSICPIGSSIDSCSNNEEERIIVKTTNEEENDSFLATLLNDKDKQEFILTALSNTTTEKTKRKRKVIQEKPYQHRRRFSSPDYQYFGLLTSTASANCCENDNKKKESSSPLKNRKRHASISSACIVTTTTTTTTLNDSQNKRRSNSFSSTSCCTSTIEMTTSSSTYSTPIPTPSQSSSSCASSIDTTTAANHVDNEDDEEEEEENGEMFYDHGWNFPQDHIVNNIAHFMRYASAAYGESFMRILGIGDIPTVLPSSHHHHPNHHAFAHHTGNSVEDILLSSYTDRSPLHLHNPSIHALVHYVTVDHAAKAVVLTCRGTLGLSDILTDLSMNYTEFTVGDQVFKAHSGMLDAAQLLAKEKGKVYQKIRQGLEMYPDYGLVMCGHSLGGGVASLLCVLWSKQLTSDCHQLVLRNNQQQDDCFSNKKMPSFVTSNSSGLPSGRPIHCYAYGPPGVMSLALSNYCAGLVTSVVHGYDIVSSLSLGLLKDFKNIATSLHAEQEAAEEIISRVIGRLKQQKKEQTEGYNEYDQWFWAMIKTMRADMTSEKMYPPSTVYLVESVPQMKQQHKVTLNRCEDVQARFSEIVFTRTMFMDHSPLMYERAIRKLCRGFSSSSSSTSPSSL